MLSKTQLPRTLREPIDDEIAIYKEGRPSITRENSIPDTKKIPIENPRVWLQIPDVICVSVDMTRSTNLSASEHPAGTARAYRLFTGTVTKILHALNAPYIDVQGDGVFALFNKEDPHLALAAGVTCKTFAAEEFAPRLKEQTGLSLGCHVGIDQHDLLVRKIGLKKEDGRSDRQNEVWAGKAVNMACKLASLAKDEELLVSNRFHSRLTDDHALKSCGCRDGHPGGDRVALWSRVSLQDDERFDFDAAFLLKSTWCKMHGAEFCQALMDADNKSRNR